MDETTSQKEEPKEHRKFSQEQWKMLLRCSENADMREWNEWREANPSKEILLEGARLWQTNLQGAELSKANLAAANLGAANLAAANLGAANLEGANLLGANLEGADLWGANLEGADLGGANLEGASLLEANLKGGHLWGANLVRAEPLGANLQGADLGSANLEGAELWGANLEGANLSYANLEGADLGTANLEGADLRRANLEGAELQEAKLERAKLGEATLKGAKLRGANLKGAKLPGANLEGADLLGANLQGAHLVEANLQSATCNRVVVNGSTLLWDCKVDLETDFLGVGLDSARVEPGLKQLLKYNSRRRNWELWYKEHRFLQWPVRLFWSMSDYGRSTARIIGAFFGLAALFAVVYYLLDVVHLPVVKNLRLGTLVFFRAIYFSIVTMTTLGFGDMHAAENSGGYLLLTLQVLLGYVLLGALVTRFAVLFQAEGPAGKFAKSQLTKKRIDVRLREIVSGFAVRVAVRIRSALLRSRTPRTPQNGPSRNKGKVNGKSR